MIAYMNAATISSATSTSQLLRLRRDWVFGSMRRSMGSLSSRFARGRRLSGGGDAPPSPLGQGSRRNPRRGDAVLTPSAASPGLVLAPRTSRDAAEGNPLEKIVNTGIMAVGGGKRRKSDKSVRRFTVQSAGPKGRNEPNAEARCDFGGRRGRILPAGRC